MEKLFRNRTTSFAVRWFTLSIALVYFSAPRWSFAGAEALGTTGAGSDGQAVLEELDTDFDTRYVDQLTLPRVAAPLASSVKLESSGAVGRNTQKNVNPSRGANVQANTGFFPTLVFRVNSRDNPARVAGGEDQNDESIFIGLDLKYRGLINSRHMYELSAAASSEDFDEFTSLDSDISEFAAALRLDMTSKLKADLYTSYADSEDSRGVTATRLLDLDTLNDEYKEITHGARVTIGRRTNPVQVVIGAERSDIDFTNNDQDQRDREDEQFLAGLYLNLSPRTSIYLLGDHTDIDYESTVSGEFDSENTQLSLGVGWEPSYSTSLLLQLGNIEKSFEQSGFEDQDTESYLGKFTWLPSDLSTLNLYASQTYEESVDLNAPVIESILSGISFGHRFSDSIRGQAYLNYIEDDLINVRQDEITDFGIGLFYNIRRWLQIGATWARTERESTDPEATYDSELLSLSLIITPRFNREFGDSEIHTGEDLRGLE
ncbi:MAG: outer membrane beta-barrel protein [bacterium]